MSTQTLVERWVKRLNNNRIAAALIVLGMVATGLASFSGAVATIADMFARARRANEPTFVELMENVGKYTIRGSIERLGFEGDVVITPVGLFRDPYSLADGSPSGYTFLLCRFTNTGARGITIGAIVNQSGHWYRLDDLGFGYRPVVDSLAQNQRFFRGRPLDPELLRPRGNDFMRSFIDAATIGVGETKYGYVNSLGSPWPTELTLEIVDATDTRVGSAKLRIELAESLPDRGQ